MHVFSDFHTKIVFSSIKVNYESQSWPKAPNQTMFQSYKFTSCVDNMQICDYLTQQPNALFYYDSSRQINATYATCRYLQFNEQELSKFWLVGLQSTTLVCHL